MNRKGVFRKPMANSKLSNGSARALRVTPLDFPLLRLLALLVINTCLGASPLVADVTLPLPLSGPAYLLAEQAFTAYDQGDYATAITRSREVVRQRPDVIAPKRLLVLSLAGAGELAAAAETASGFIAEGDSDAELIAMRDRIQDQITARAGATSPTLAAPRPKPDPAFQAADRAYRASAKGQHTQAAELARQAVKLAPGKIAYRRLLISALIAADQPQAAVEEASQALEHWPGNGELLALRGDACQRQGEAAQALADYAAALKSPDLTDRQAFDWRLALADAAMAAHAPETALAALTELANLTIPRQEAPAYDLDSRRGYALLALNRPEEALSALTQALAAQKLDRDGMLNAAYVAKRLALNTQAIDLFKAALADPVTESAPWDAQRRFEIRREVAELSRTWGAYASLSYGGVGLMPNALQPAATSSGGKVLQAGLELYWRPPRIGFRNGRIVELFGRVFETLSHTQEQGQEAGATGPQTRQGALGIRWKPFTDYNLILEVGRLIKLGDQARSDWLLRAAISLGQGLDLRLAPSSWWQWQLYGEWVNYPETPQNLSNFEGRLGRSFRLTNPLDRLVVTPFLAIGGGYDDTLKTPEALGAGPGVNLRVWFREDADHAPRSYLDANLQYRFKLAGDDRAEGVFASLMLAW